MAVTLTSAIPHRASPACLIALMALAAMAVVAHDAAPDSNVIIGTDSNFHGLLKDHPVSLVMFYAPWCGHCKTLLPVFEDVASDLLGDVALIKVDATEQEALATEYGIRAYPTVRFFKKGNAVDYDGPRDVVGMEHWLMTRVTPAATTLVGSVMEFVDDSLYATVVATMPSTVNPAVLAAFEAFAEEYRGRFRTAILEDEGLRNNPDMKELGAIYVYKPVHLVGVHEKAMDVLVLTEDTASLETVAHFVWSNAFAEVPYIRGHDVDALKSAQKPVVFIFVSDGTTEDEIVTVAEETRKALGDVSSLRAAIVTPGEMLDLVTLLDMTHSYPFLAIVDSGNRRFHPAKTSLKTLAADLKDYVDQYHANDVEQHIRSLAVEVDPKSNVVDLIGETWGAVVTDNRASKDILIEFYAPWCGHCKKLAPIYEELADLFEDVDSLIIARIDATANDLFEFDGQVRGYPSIYFLAAGVKEPIKYQSPRTLEAFEAFIQKNAVTL